MKCGDVVEMWLGMLDIANMTKSQIQLMETKADPGELLVGLEASLNIFHGTTRSTTTSNTKRNSSRLTEPTNYEEILVNKILYDTPMWHNLSGVCLIEDDEIGIISENYRRSKSKDEDEDMEQSGQGTGAGSSAAQGPETTSTGADAEGVGKSATPDERHAPGTPPNPEEEFQILVIDAIDALFALADDNNVCLRCGEGGHANYECTARGDDPVKSALINLRKKLQGEEVEGEVPPQDTADQEQQQQDGYQATREGEYMYLRPIPLSVIGDRAHGEKSTNGVKATDKGPATKQGLNNLVEIASQRGVTLTCKDMKDAVTYSDHKMYKKLKIGTDIGKLKILPLNGGTFYSRCYAGGGIEFPSPTDQNSHKVDLDTWEDNYCYYFNKALRHHIGRTQVWERGDQGVPYTRYPGLKCAEAGWVDIMDFLHHGWIFDHEEVQLENDGYVAPDVREERVNTMIKTVWSEFQRKNKVRIQFLCIVLDSSFKKPDGYLRDVMGVGDDIHQLIAQNGEVFLAPIAVRSCTWRLFSTRK